MLALEQNKEKRLLEVPRGMKRHNVGVRMPCEDNLDGELQHAKRGILKHLAGGWNDATALRSLSQHCRSNGAEAPKTNGHAFHLQLHHHSLTHNGKSIIHGVEVYPAYVPVKQVGWRSSRLTTAYSHIQRRQVPAANGRNRLPLLVRGAMEFSIT